MKILFFDKKYFVDCEKCSIFALRIARVWVSRNQNAFKLINL